MKQNTKTTLILIIIAGILVVLFGHNFGLFALTSNYDSCLPYQIGNYTNLINNGDFEQGTWNAAGDCNCMLASCRANPTFNPTDYQNWEVIDNTNPLGHSGTFKKLDGSVSGSFEFLSRESPDTKSGSKSEELIGRRANACVGSNWVDVTPSTPYTVSFYFKNVRGPGNVRYIVVQSLNNGKSTYSPSISFPSEVNDGAWHYYQDTFITSPDAVRLNVNLYSQGGESESNDSVSIIRYDDVRLVKGTLPCLSRIQNETGEPIVVTEETGQLFDWNSVIYDFNGFEIKLWMVVALGVALIVLLLIK